MKKLLLPAFLSIAMASNAQIQKLMQPCNTFAMMEKRFKENPEARISYEKNQAYLRQLYLERKDQHIAGKTAAFQYTIPIVFHILHTGGTENLSDATIQAAVNTINSDYAAAGADFNTIAAPFQSLYINSDIRFMLAKKDPNGNCTTGIEHVYDTRTMWNSGTSSYGGLAWDPTKYLNVIVVKQIDDGSTIGYTWLPGTWPAGAAQDAIVYGASFLNGLDARSLSHEIGHWFNLQHTFGPTNNPGVSCGDDGINDTPPTMGTFACPNSLTGNPCNGGGNNNVENFMDYSSCPKNFTTDQTNVMRTAIASTVSSRDNLSTPGNLAATGVNSVVSCAPISDFLSSSNTYTVCSGSPINMIDYSYNGTVTSWSWTASGGASIANPNASVTNITFPNPGTETVTLVVSNNQGSSQKSRTVTIINSASGVPPSYYESFESPNPPTGWSVTNANPGSVTWAQTNLAASSGTQSYFIQGESDIANHVDYLQMPVLDVATYSNNLFTFKYAYARKAASTNDKLEVQASMDCGGTWQTIAGLSAQTMANGSGGVDPNPFVPTLSQWKLCDVTQYPLWFNYTSSNSVMIRFKFTEDENGIGFNNRIYIDEVNFNDPNGINEYNKSLRFSVSPNPTAGNFSARFKLDNSANVKITVSDIQGREVLPATSLQLLPGEQNIELNDNKSLSSGMYFVKLSANNSNVVQKIIVE